MGLSQNISVAMEGKAYVELGPLYVDQLYRQGAIPTPTFSFYMSTFGESRVDFGEPVTNGTYENAVAARRYTNVLNDFFWS
jgi:hypothetical protein